MPNKPKGSNGSLAADEKALSCIGYLTKRNWPGCSMSGRPRSRKFAWLELHFSKVWLRKFKQQKEFIQVVKRGPAYPQPGKVPDFLFVPFSFVNKAIEGNGAKISIAFVEDGGELHAFYDGVL